MYKRNVYTYVMRHLIEFWWLFMRESNSRQYSAWRALCTTAEIIVEHHKSIFSFWHIFSQ